MLQEQAGIRYFFEHQRSRVLGFLKRIERSFAPQDPLVAVIRREGVIRDGRYVMHFRVTLFGDNPVVLEEFGAVKNREREPAPSFRPELAQIVENYRYFIELRQRFHSIEAARDFWLSRGATTLWHD